MPRHTTPLAMLFTKVLVILALASAAARAEVITDGADDLLGSFVPGDPVPTAHGDVDVISSEVTLNTSTNQLIFSGTHAANIGTSLNDAGVASAVYVWGLNRGEGLDLLDDIVLNGTVLFDSVVVLTVGGAGSFFLDLFNQSPPVPLAPGSVTVNGPTITGVVPLSIIPALPNGFAVEDYTWNLWPRFLFDSQADILTNPAVSDFAPDGDNARLTIIGQVMEPSSLASFLLGLTALGWLRRRRSR